MKGILKGRRFLIVMILMIWWCFPALQWAADGANITEVGQWTGRDSRFLDVAVSGNYAYCVNYGGLTILDISTPTLPVEVGSYPEPFNYNDLYSDIVVKNKRAYIIKDNSLIIMDISKPLAPSLWGKIKLPNRGSHLRLDGNHAYIRGFNSIYIIDISGATPPTTMVSYDSGYYVKNFQVQNGTMYLAAGEDGVKILDVSNPSQPKQVGEIANNYDDAVYVHISGNRLYVMEEYSGLVIYDISKPHSPSKLGEYSGSFSSLCVEGSNAYLWSSYVFTILDISNPASPALKFTKSYSNSLEAVLAKNNRLYIADSLRGFKIMDVSDPARPVTIGLYGAYGDALDLLKDGKFLYVGRKYGLNILDVSSLSSPSLVAAILIDNSVSDIAKKGTHLYLAVNIANDHRFRVYNMANPANPVLAADVDIKNSAIRFLSIIGNYVYIGFEYTILVYDISVPAAPVLATTLLSGGDFIYPAGNNAYLVDDFDLKRLDVSSPGSPSIRNSFDLPEDFFPWLVAVKGNYLYVTGGRKLLVYDISSPGSPRLYQSFSETHHYLYEIIIDGSNAYTLNEDGIINVLDISSPGRPRLAGHKDARYARLMCLDNGYIFCSGKSYDYVDIYRFQKVSEIPVITLSRDSVNIVGVKVGDSYVSQEQEVWVNAPHSTSWEVDTNKSWLDFSRSTYSGSGKLTLDAVSYYLDPGLYSGTVEVYNSYCMFDSQTISVNLQLYDENQTGGPFGQMATPTDYARVSGSVPVTGWALDDVGVSGVKIYLASGGARTLIGDAVFVEGARPDVEQSYPTYPGNSRAGWGYMLLTHFLPGGGNGNYTIHAIATDVEGNETTLGTRTFICDNAGAVKPFGAIDTPTQGGLASGSGYINWGWALTPQPNSIPTDGSTINIWVDGVNLGHPVYNLYREDIATLLPGFANSDGAVGYFYLDTTTYANGVHTIQWTVSDNAGNSDGVGSRYFTIQNSSGSRTATHTEANSRSSFAPLSQGDVKLQLPRLDRFQVNTADPVRVKRGFGKTKPVELLAGETGYYTLQTAELEPLEIVFPETSQVLWGALTAGKLVKPLPIGSTLDKADNKFLWSPGPGFVGDYTLVFLEELADGSRTLKKVIVRIIPGSN